MLPWKFLKNLMSHSAPVNFKFISTMDTAPWGGSELLWSEAAKVLVREGHKVSACVHGWSSRPKEIAELARYGVEIFERKPVFPNQLELMGRRFRLLPNRDLAALAFDQWLSSGKTDLLCFSDGRVVSNPEWGEKCEKNRICYVNLCQANSVGFWPPDSTLPAKRKFLKSAERCFFVSQNNLGLCERQIGEKLPHAEVVRNPFGVPFDQQPSWRSAGEFELELACVGRLEPVSKGQDILFEVLSSEKWRKRSLRVSLFGSGCCAESLKDLCRFLGIENQVRFCGHVADVKNIWMDHDALVLPSRHEGLPIALVEAMLCHRAVIATDVAGNGEFINDGLTGFLADCPSSRSLDAALERAWNSREKLREIGLEAGRKIREVLPPKPVEVFANRLLEIARS